MAHRKDHAASKYFHPILSTPSESLGGEALSGDSGAVTRQRVPERRREHRSGMLKSPSSEMLGSKQRSMESVV